MASSPPTPRIAAPRICLVSASTAIFMKPCVSPFSTARPTRVIGRMPTSALRPDLRISVSVMPARPSGGSMKRPYAVMRSRTLRCVAVQQVVGDDLVVVVRGVGERAAPVAIADRPDAGHAGVQLVVHGDVAACVGVDARALRARGRRCSARVRPRAADANRRPRAQPPAQSSLTAICAPRFSTAMHSAPSFDDDALVAQDVRAPPCDTSSSSRAMTRGIFSTIVTRDAEAPVHLAELEPDVAAADDDQVLGQKVDIHHRRIGEIAGRRRGPASAARARGRRH